MPNKSRFLIAAFMAFATSSHAIQLAPGAPDPKNEARAVALEKLRSLSGPDTRAFMLEKPSRLESASLADPFIQFWTDETFAQYETAAAGESMMPFVARYCLSFPVVLDNQVLGTIDVIRETDRYRVVSVHVGADQWHQLDAARRQLDLGKDERLSVFTAVGIGGYLVIEDGTRFLSMTPLDLQAGRAREGEASDQLLPEDRFSEQFKAAIRESRKRTVGTKDVKRLPAER